MSGRSNQFWLVQAATDQKSIPTRLFDRALDHDEDIKDGDDWKSLLWNISCHRVKLQMTIKNTIFNVKQRGHVHE